MKKLFLVIAFSLVCTSNAAEVEEKINYGKWLKSYDTRPIVAKIASQLESTYTNIQIPAEMEQENAQRITIDCEGEIGNDDAYNKIARAFYYLYHDKDLTEISNCYHLEDAKKMCGKLAVVNQILANKIKEQRVQALSNWYIVTTFQDNNYLNPEYVSLLFKQAFPRDRRTCGGWRIAEDQKD